MKRLFTIYLISLSGAMMHCNQEADRIIQQEKEPDWDNYQFAIEVGNSKLPYIVISTNTTIQNEPKVPASMAIFEAKQLVQTARIGIEYRGSTSFRITDKKSYGIEVWDENGADAKASFFGFPEEEDWILTGHVVNTEGQYIIDRTMMYHYLAYNLFSEMGNYASRCKFAEVEINGVYQGVYVFMEKLKRSKDRIDIASLKSDDTDISGGYILKIDKTAGGDNASNQPLEYYLSNWEDDARYNENISFRSIYDIFGNVMQMAPYGPPYHNDQYLETYFLYEYPKPANITSEQKNYIQNYIQDFETALLTDDFQFATRTYTDYIDLNSFVDFFIINELCANIDGYRISTYMYKNRGEKLKMGPVWDFNIGFDSGGRIPWDDWVINYNNYVQQDAWMMPFWWPRLMEDPLFRDALKTRWSALRSGALSTNKILNLVDETASYLEENGAIKRNYALWDNGLNVNYQESVGSLKNFLSFRSDWMDSKIEGL